MDQTYLLVLAVAIIVALASLGLIRARQRREATAAGPSESPFAVSTEGMKICPSCGMGNLWSDARCVSCKRPLKG